jgi:hypothetical protein
MRITNLITESVGQRRHYFNIGFKIRDLSTNTVSDWLPLKIVVNRNFKSVGAGKSHFVRFKTF